MNTLQQTLHIVRKDMKHLTPEIAVSISLVAIFAWIAPATWPGYLTKMAYPGIQFGAPAVINVFLHALIPISWLILISRVVHDESLVGDKQFWVTRPYTWYSLLMAKLLFVVSFLCLPLLAAQVFLVGYAGLPVLASLPGLLMNIGAIFLFFLLPFLAIAAVTSSFGPMALLVLAGVIYIGIVALLETFFSGLRAVHMAALHGCLLVVGIILVATLVYQYMARKTGASQLILIATPIVAALVVYVAPTNTLFRHTYGASTGPTMHVDLDPMRQQPTTGPVLIVRDHMVLSLPLTGAVVPETEMLTGSALQMDLTSASGYHWASVWEGFPNTVSGQTRADILIPEPVVRRIGNEVVSVKLTLAVDRGGMETSNGLKMSEANQVIPGGGVCSLVGDAATSLPVCRYLLRSPVAYIESESPREDSILACGASATPPIPMRFFITPHSGAFAFDPVVAENLRPLGDNPNGNHLFVVCPGAPMRVSSARPSGKEMIQVEQTGLELTPYLRHITQQQRPMPAIPAEPQQPVQQ